MKKQIIFGIILAFFLMLIASCNNETSPNVSTISQQTTAPSSLVSGEDAPVSIDQNSDGQTVHVNLVKFTGKVPLNASITVNNSSVISNKDRSYYKILDLVPGKNIISVRTFRGVSTETENITVFFSPPLVVYLFTPQFDYSGNVDYSKAPLDIAGYVSYPQAEINVYGQPVRVASDGTFSTQVVLQPNKLITATATLGQETDTDTLNLILITETGQIGIAPGAGLLGESYLQGYTKFKMKPGATIDSSFSFSARRDNTNPGDTCELKIAGDSLIQPAPEIYFDPASFGIYTNVNYHVPLIIQTSKDVAPGDYQFSIITDFGKLSWISTIVVTVGPPENK